MPQYTHSMPIGLRLKSYDDVIKTHDCFSRCLKSVFSDYSDLELSTSIHFEANDVRYRCMSIEEFREEAFALDLKHTELAVHASRSLPKWEGLGSLLTRNPLARENPLITVYSNNKIHLSLLEEALRKEPLFCSFSIDILVASASDNVPASMPATAAPDSLLEAESTSERKRCLIIPTRLVATVVLLVISGIIAAVYPLLLWPTIAMGSLMIALGTVFGTFVLPQRGAIDSSVKLELPTGNVKSWGVALCRYLIHTVLRSVIDMVTQGWFRTR